ncbi:ABC transporter ATP-binding protein [Gluconacetobacter azotocaptans]|uniref:ABC transporter ATP-binding protein n=1 Tax=Gluconacetobacter azotocaptans TaxID=142834 RepID=UPI00195E5AFF|nr:ABC transporter ATP-binding protein [Gluconacetobacter azotocaptans]MBM9399996.1 ABC transporter ATP-binding protein [Gluconacetobacter azotocaptans]
MPGIAAAVDLRDVGVRFSRDGRDVVALDAVSFRVPVGGFTTLLGPSGCGKSTLLRVVADIVRPSTGTARLFGQSPAQARRDRAIGFVFQDAALLPWRNAIDNVRLPLQVGRRPGMKQGRRSAEELLALVGLGGRAGAFPHELSGGMRQRVSIARALLQEPRILLMDEPFGALDEITRDRLNDVLLDVWRETGTTILFVTHSIHEAAYLGQDVMLLAAHPGRVREIVPVELDGPRVPAVRDRPEFATLTGRLRRILETC